MASFDQRLEQLADKGIMQAIDDAARTLVAGQLASHADYRYHCGIIAGLQRARELIDQALADIQKG